MEEGPERGDVVRRRGVERSVEVQLGPLGGFDVRPTRIFVWTGDEREGRERVVSLGSAPRNLRIPRRERELETPGGVRVRSLGNPLMTVALAGVHAARRIAKDRAALRESSTERGSAGPASTPARRSPD